MTAKFIQKVIRSARNTVELVRKKKIRGPISDEVVVIVELAAENERLRSCLAEPDGIYDVYSVVMTARAAVIRKEATARDLVIVGLANEIERLRAQNKALR